MKMNEKAIWDFATESNIIEGITSAKARMNMVHALGWFLKIRELALDEVVKFALELGPKCVLRDKLGMNVKVNGYYPVLGDPLMSTRINDLIFNMGRSDYTPFVVHCEFEKLHPFMDGNGRTGRAMWL